MTPTDFTIMGRGEGKTMRLVAWASDAAPGERRIIVCLNEREATRVNRTHGVETVSYERLKVHSFGPDVELALDDADVVLVQLLGTRFERIAATGTT